MGDWHAAKVKASAKRRKKRVLQHIRLTFVVFNGWISSRVSSSGWVRDTRGWKMSGPKWTRIKGRGPFEVRWEKVKIEERGLAGWETHVCVFREALRELRKK
jgi:hypothetical protein